jgi:ABC-type phosphate/phosphonate transport system substrate-binding protein
MIASLGMYDFGAAMAANDRFWALIRDGLRAAGQPAPETLTRGEAAYWPAWQSPDLTLSQTCGYPFRARLHDRVTYIGTPDYGVEGCPPGYYRSVFVARNSDARSTLAEFDGARFAYNEDLSQSGWAAPQTHARARGIHLHPAVQSGGHRLSARAVADGQADIACLDMNTLSLMQDCDPVVSDLKLLEMTEPTPGLAYIAAPGSDAELLFATIEAAIAALSPQDRTSLRLHGLTRIPPAAYLDVPDPPAPAQFAQTA